jgi:hypothetical protein
MSNVNYTNNTISAKLKFHLQNEIYSENCFTDHLLMKSNEFGQDFQIVGSEVLKAVVMKISTLCDYNAL